MYFEHDMASNTEAEKLCIVVNIMNAILAGVTGLNPDFRCNWVEPKDKNGNSLFLILGINLELADPRVIEAVRRLKETIEETEFK